MTRILIIGGSDAGTVAALRAREVDSSADMTMLLADRFPNFSVCGLPFFLSGEVPDWKSLAHRPVEVIQSSGIQVRVEHTATGINCAQKRVLVRSASGMGEVPYDRLIIATGATPLEPSIRGLEKPGVFVLRTMADALRFQPHLEALKTKTAAIVGGGYIGMEMADALARRGFEVTLIEHGPNVLKTVGPELGDLVKAELERNGVRVVTGVSVDSISRDESSLAVHGREFEVRASLILIATGVRPASELAHSAGIALGVGGAIRVGRAMETSEPDIFAAGDCAETFHALLRRSDYLPLGTTAHKQGRVAGENAAGGKRTFNGTLGTQIVKIFDLAVGRTGIDDAQAGRAGFKPLTVATMAPDHNVYYPHAHEIHLHLTGDRESGRLLGAQIAGNYRADIPRRIDVVATAIFNGITVDGLSDLDLSYTPPLGTPWDALQVAAQAWTRKRRGESHG